VQDHRGRGCDRRHGLASPYRSALGINAALEELRKGRGRQYDESVVDACIKVITKGEIKI
jgi:HD-GYP domain-containing protein (c-di-GMP phosphodiesterase class II)